jgi:hypothetical protein
LCQYMPLAFRLDGYGLGRGRMLARGMLKE